MQGLRARTAAGVARGAPILPALLLPQETGVTEVARLAALALTDQASLLAGRPGGRARAPPTGPLDRGRRPLLLASGSGSACISSSTTGLVRDHYHPARDPGFSSCCDEGVVSSEHDIATSYQ